MTPRWGEYDLLLFFLSDSSFQSRTHEGLFELTRRLSRTLCNVLGAEVPGHRQETTDAKLKPMMGRQTFAHTPEVT